MHVEEHWCSGVPVLRVTDRALVKPPDWAACGLPTDAGTVALDLGNVEFISSLFWQACVGLARELAGNGGRLLLLNVASQHAPVLALVEGSGALCIVDDEEQLPEWAKEDSARARSEDGVGRTERNVLWR
jgi:hypothetical protein